MFSKKKSPLVSIIMNCHNGSEYLKFSIISIINQTYNNWELIFWDNKSTDKSKNILKKFKDKRIKYFFSKKFCSLYDARNLAIQKAKGSYICFLDTDDYWKKNFISSFLKKITIKKCEIVFSKYFINNLKKKKIYINTKKMFPETVSTQNLLDNYLLGINAIMIKKEVLLKHKFNKKYNIIGDFDLFIRLSNIYKFHSLNKPLAFYRVHDLNYSKRNLADYILEMNNWLDSKDKYFINEMNFNKMKFFILKLQIKHLLNKFFKLQ